MKRVLKFAGYALGVIVVLLLVAAGSVYALSSGRLHKSYQVAVKPVIIPTDAAAIQRGNHIAHTRGCIDCHGADFGGYKVIDDPAIGLMCGPNLTGGQGSITQTFNNDDWVRAIRHGVAKDGHALVLMPSIEFSHFSDDDLGALIAYLKTVPVVNRDRVPVTVGPVARALILAGKIQLAAEHIDHVGLVPPVIVPGVTIEYGRYLSAGCVGCHGEQLVGGKIASGPPSWPHSRNLTPAGDLAKWTEADFFNTLKTGVRPDGLKLSPVMPLAFGQMNDTEIKALWVYLKSIPAVAGEKL